VLVAVVPHLLAVLVVAVPLVLQAVLAVLALRPQPRRAQPVLLARRALLQQPLLPLGSSVPLLPFKEGETLGL